ncbi:MAG: hypothetical protein AAB036_07950 [Elusimicrobiota bacterium]
MRAALLPLFLVWAPLARAQPSEDRLNALEQRLSSLENARSNNATSAFNPALGAALDIAAVQTDSKATINLRAAELTLQAPIDPYLKGWIVATGSPDTVSLEEAAVRTTALPHSLSLTAGRLFASFGRLARFHDHELPVIERPRSLDTFVGGETQADGVELSYLFPTPFYLSAQAGMFNKIGADNARADNAVERPLDNFTYLGRLTAYADFGDDHSLELGASQAWTPKRIVPDAAGTETTRKNTWRTLAGIDLTYRYQPVAGGLYKGAIWSAEIMQNNERRFDAATLLPRDRVRSYAGVSYLQLKLGRRFSPGVMIDLSEDLDAPKTLTRTYTGFLSFHMSEYQRLRVSASRIDDAAAPGRRGNRLGLQWTAVLGVHTHSFKDR